MSTADWIGLGLIILLFLAVVCLYVRLGRVQNILDGLAGKDGERIRKENLLRKYDEINGFTEMILQNNEEIIRIEEQQKKYLYKIGIVRYDAFPDFGGTLSFAVTMLTQENNGIIINSLHTKDGGYTYLKEIVRGESYLELSKEEAESLRRAIEEETYTID